MAAKENPEFTESLEGKSEMDACEQETPFTAGESSEPSRPSRREGDAVGVLLSDVQMKPVEWVWKHRIPLGKMTIIDGNPGVGKSTLTNDIAARVTVGANMPDGTASCLGGPRGVVLLSAEDGAEDTVRPRVEAAGGDPARVFMLKAVVTEDGERMPNIGDLDAIRQAVLKVDAKLIVIDPLFAYTGRSDAHRDAEMRSALAPLIALCEELGVALLVLRHLNKNVSVGSAMYRGGGTIGIIGAARCAFVASRDPSDDSRCVLAAVKMNLCRPPPALAYHLEGHNVAVAGTTSVVPTSRIVWDGTADVTADALVAPQGTESSSQRQAAIEFLQEELKGGPVPSSEVEKHAKQHGFSARTISRARSKLGVVAYREDPKNQSPWMARLPDAPPSSSGASSPPPDSPVRADRQGADGQPSGAGVGDLAEVMEERVLGAPTGGQSARTHELGDQPPDPAPPSPSPATGPTPFGGVIIEGRPAVALMLPPFRTLTLPVGRSSTSNPGERLGVAPSAAAQGVPAAGHAGDETVPFNPVNTAFHQIMQRTGKAAQAAPTHAPPLPLGANGLVMGLVQILNSWQGEDFFRAHDARFEKGQAHETQSLWRPRQKIGR